MHSAQLPLFETRPRPLKVQGEVTHEVLGCKTVLNYCDTRRMPDTYTINPYRGCEFGCRYCYARYTHAFMELPWEDFENRIFVKRGAARALGRTLDVSRIGQRHLAIGTATDPYQPAEAKWKVTRGLLEILEQVSGLTISVTTKSSLIKRDVDLLARLASRHRLQINISLISLDEALLRALEPKATRPAARLETLRVLRQSGIRAGIFMMPILPGLTDSESDIDRVVREARLADAQFVSWNVLFLRDSSKSIFFAHLRRLHPEIYGRCRRLFEDPGGALRDYQAKIAARVRRVKVRYGYTKQTSLPRAEARKAVAN